MQTPSFVDDGCIPSVVAPVLCGRERGKPRRRHNAPRLLRAASASDHTRGHEVTHPAIAAGVDLRHCPSSNAFRQLAGTCHASSLRPLSGPCYAGEGTLFLDTASLIAAKNSLINFARQLAQGTGVMRIFRICRAD